MKIFRLKIALTVICLLAMLAVGLRAMPRTGSQFLPYGGDPKGEVDQLIIRSVEEPDLSLAINELLAEALRLSPLASEPLFAYALFKGTNADAALEEALRRNPRELSARLLVARHLIDEERYDESVEQIVTLMGVDRSRQTDYINALVEMSVTEGGEKALLEALAVPRRWSPRLIEQLNQRAENFAFLFEANKLVPDGRKVFLERLTSEGRYDLALLAWLDFSNIDTAQISWPFNPDFQELDVLPPFNWVSENDRTEFMRGGGVYLVHLARKNTVFTRQFMALGPGEYDLGIDAMGQRIVNGGGIFLELTCTGTDEVVAKIPLGQLPGEGTTKSLPFVVDAACSFQELKLTGEIGQFPRVTRLEVRRVSIEPASSVAKPSSGEGEG